MRERTAKLQKDAGRDFRAIDISLMAMLMLILCMALAACGSPSVEPCDLAAYPDHPDFRIEIESSDAVLRDVSAEDMSSLPAYSIEVRTVNSYGTEETHIYAGYKLSDVLNASGASADGVSSLIAEADDGYTYSCDIKTALKDTTLIALYKDGELSAAGPWFAPCSSQNSPDYVKALTRITILAN